MPELTIIGLKELQATVQRAGTRALLLMAQAMFTEATFIMAKSVPKVPVDTGVLRASATVEAPKTNGTIVSLRFGYGGAASKYALATHENPRSGKTGGRSPGGVPYEHYAASGQWKFLEGPANELFPTSAQRMAVTMRTLFA